MKQTKAVNYYKKNTIKLITDMFLSEKDLDDKIELLLDLINKIRADEREKRDRIIDNCLDIPMYLKSYKFPDILKELKQKLKEGE